MKLGLGLSFSWKRARQSEIQLKTHLGLVLQSGSKLERQNVRLPLQLWKVCQKVRFVMEKNTNLG